MKKATKNNTAAKVAKTTTTKKAKAIGNLKADLAAAAAPKVEASDWVQIDKTSSKRVADTLWQALKGAGIKARQQKASGTVATVVKPADKEKAEEIKAKAFGIVKAEKPAPVVPESEQVTEGAPGAGGGKAAKPAKQPKAAKPAKVEKAEKPKDETLKVRLYAKGEFYFGRLAGERLGELPHVALAIKGKTVTLTPQKSEKDATPVMRCHAAKVLRVAKLLADTGWSKATQDLVAEPVGENGLRVVIA